MMMPQELKMNKLSNFNMPGPSKDSTPDIILRRIHELYQKKNVKQAVKFTKLYTKKYSSNLPFMVAVAGLAVSYDEKDIAKKLLTKVLRKEPENVRGLYNKGLLYLKNGNLINAKKLFSHAVVIDPNYTSAVQNLVYILVGEKDANEISKWYKKISENGSLSEKNLSTFMKAFKSLSMNHNFVESAKLLIKLNPNSFESNFNFALAMHRAGESKVAKEYYNNALIIKPNDLDASNNLAKLFFDEGSVANAIKILDKTDLQTADKPSILLNMGVALYYVGEVERATKYLTRAVDLSPELGDPHYTLGLIAKDKNEYELAQSHFSNAINSCAIETSTYTDSIAQKWLLARYSLDWKISESEESKIQALGIDTAHIAPFSALPMEDNPHRQLLRAQNFTKESYPNWCQAKDFSHYRSAEIINIAYISADFHQFPGMTLMSGMFAEHDRSKFKVFALSYGPDRNDEMRQKVVRDVDKFIDVRDFTDDEIVSLCANLNIHIAIHRNGYTKSHRTGIFAKRAAPIQVNYLGYPSTMGADFMDYLVADKFTIPTEHRGAYSENIIYMPGCYQPNDSSRDWPTDSKSKADHGLDENNIILCCFNNSYKISAVEFELWCSVLNTYEQTQLWLLDPGAQGRENIGKLLDSKSICRNRVIFAPKVDHTSHMARHSHADIFVDTFNYNAHTTATDALGMGLPVVTMAGKQFSARVAGSILSAASMPDLVASNTDEYVGLICELIDNPKLLSQYKRRCLDLRNNSALFNTKLYVRNFEKSLTTAFQLFQSGEIPHDIEC